MSKDEVLNDARGAEQYPDSADGCVVFAFDRDYTVDVNPPPRDDQEAVPLEWVRYLAHETEHIVFATGNQLLREEADIPGIPTMLDLHPEPEEYAGPPEMWGRHRPRRADRSRMLAEIYPNADRYIVVDDADLSDLEGWEYYPSWEFVPKARDDAFPFDPGTALATVECDLQRPVDDWALRNY